MRLNPLKSVTAAILVAGLGCSVASLPAMAQDRDQDRDQARDQGWNHERDTFYQGQGWKMRLFDRVREDLDHVQASSFAGGADEHRLDRTKEELTALQGKLASHQYDQPQLDEVIASLNRVLADNRLSARDRDILTDDLNRMRDYREHHADWR
ncbi:MAG TPA: hypothetical protein VG273_26175 [Bryobacteraceae bacterium]|jgi:hypothetical protein|nr:hypothetical protein [Bryobacteraceae bacterium]